MLILLFLIVAKEELALKNDREKDLNNSKLDYKKQFVRTLWLIPLGVLSVVFVLITDEPAKTPTALSLLVVVTIVGKLFYTYKKMRGTSSTE